MWEACSLGLAPSPWQSGRVERDQGIAKSGNPRARRTAIELAWLWLRHQPGSALARWFHERVAGAKGRMRRIMLVALARKPIVALWRYVTIGTVPEGAVLKAGTGSPPRLQGCCDEAGWTWTAPPQGQPECRHKDGSCPPGLAFAHARGTVVRHPPRADRM